MSDLKFDASAAFDSYRNAWAPTVRAQQEVLKAIESFGRFQFAIAGDYLEWTMAQAKANFAAGTPAALAATQTALATQFGDKFKSRVQEFVAIASSAQSSFNALLGEATAKLAETLKKSP
ncbi:MAG TPA: phasin family protein [Steroidobacteraceae bacterium]|nr:phasin family protein [Steroidobacteraceae bacterium]